MVSAAQAVASSAAERPRQGAGASPGPSMPADLRTEDSQSPLGICADDHINMLQKKDFTFYMSQISFSEYNTQKSKLLPELEGLIAQIGPHGFSANEERTTLFRQAILPSQDYDSVMRSIERILQYTSVIIRHANSTGQADGLTLLIEYLADASRIDVWRLPLGAYGIVDNCLELLANNEDANSSWPAHALRLLSNCCVDLVDPGSADPNKSIITSTIDLKSILPLLEVQKTYKPCLFFIYQLSTDNVHFQERLSTHDLVSHLANLLGSDWFCDDQALDRACDMFQWPACEGSLLLRGPEILTMLLRASKVCRISTEINASLTILLSTILEKSKIKIIDHQISEILHFFQHNRPEDSKQIPGLLVSEERSTSDEDADSDDSEEEVHQETLLSARKHLANTLGQLAARPEISESLSSGSETFQLLWKWLSFSEADVSICALLMIGNIAFGSERRSVELAEQVEIIPQLVRITEHASNGLVLRSAFEVVQIFSRSPRNRLSFGQHGMFEAMSRSWQQSTDTQLRISALHHTRQLLHECLGNIYHFVHERPRPSAQPLLHHVMALFREEQVPDVRVQCGLIVVEIWHTFLAKSRGHSAALEDPKLNYGAITEGPERSISEAVTDPNWQLQSFDTRGSDFTLLKHAMMNMCQVHPDIIKPFLAVIGSGNPSLATRTWLTLALMSREPSCADVLYSSLIDGEGSAVFRAILVDQEKAKSKDASNARFLLYELKQRSVSAQRSLHNVAACSRLQVADVKRTAVLSSLWQTLA